MRGSSEINDAIEITERISQEFALVQISGTT
jgi:hypothetical protein